MGIKKIIAINTLCLSIFLLFPFAKVHAAGASLNLSPQTANVQTGQILTVNLVVDGGGQAFNAVKATVVISPSLRIQSVTMGDCGFAFVRTPSDSDASFAGVILGSSATSCTAYTLTLQAVQSGIGSITIVNGSVKSYKGAQEILVSSNNAAYTISGSTQVHSAPVVTQPPVQGPNGVKLYTLIVHVDVPPSISPLSLKVILDRSLPGEQVAASFTQSSLALPITFHNVPQGVHTIETFSNNVAIVKQIATVGGTNGTLVFGMSTKKTTVPWALYIILVLGVGILTFVGVLLYKKYLHKSQNTVGTS